MKTNLIALLIIVAAAMSGCATTQPPIPPPMLPTIPNDVAYFKEGDAVRNKISGQVGIVTYGFFDPLFSVWRYRVRYMSISEARVRRHPTDGQEWERAYELELLERAAYVGYPMEYSPK